MGQDPYSHGLWEASAPLASATSPLNGGIAADVAVVGGGFTGISAALHLAAAGHRAVVLEAAEIGFGGSGRNVGLVNAGLWIKPDDVVAALGPVFGERLLVQLGEAPGLVFDIVARYGITCEAVHAGTLHCAAGRQGLADITDRARQWQGRGAPVELLDSRAAAEHIGSEAYTGALLDRRAGTIQPLAYVRGLADHALRLGAAIYTRSPAMACEDTGTAWRITTPAGSVIAPWVIVATDAYSAGPWSGVRREQIMLPYFNLATPPLSDGIRASLLPGREGAWDTRSILSSFRFDMQGRLVFGSVGALRGPGRRIHKDWGARTLAKIFPQLGKTSFEHAWYGQIGMTSDAAPRLHRHGRNMISISGFNGRGIAPGTTFGRDLARVAMGEVGLDDLSLPVTDQRAAPFRAAKGAFYEVGAQLAHFAGSRF
ncbi:MAG: FAD-binding oxidoreductase [Pseudomonadota bacterium]